MGPGEPSTKRFILPCPWKPGALLQDDGRLTLLSLQTDSEVIRGAASISGQPLGWERAAGATGTCQSSGARTSTAWHHVSVTCTRAWCSSAAPRAGRCSRGTGSRLPASTLCPWSASALGTWLPPPRFQRMGTGSLWSHRCETDAPSFFPSLLFELECVSCAPPTTLYFGSTWQVRFHRHSWGMCLRMNLTLSLTYI